MGGTARKIQKELARHEADLKTPLSKETKNVAPLVEHVHRGEKPLYDQQLGAPFPNDATSASEWTHTHRDVLRAALFGGASRARSTY